MNLLSKWFGGGSKSVYDDGQLVALGMQALKADSLSAAQGLVVTSQAGVVTLSGNIARRQDRERIEGIVRTAYTVAGVKLERVINNLKAANA